MTMSHQREYINKDTEIIFKKNQMEMLKLRSNITKVSESETLSVISDSLWPHSPWNCPGQDTGVGSLSLLQGIFPTQGLNPDLPHGSQILYQLSYQGSSNEEELKSLLMKVKVLPWWLRWWRICLPCRRLGFDSWVGKIPWRRDWQPTPVFLPGESHGQRSLAGHSPWGCKSQTQFSD